MHTRTHAIPTAPRRPRCIAWLAVLFSIALALAACGGRDDGDPAAVTMGKAGGSVSEASGASVSVPANALAADTTVRIAQNSTDAPALPSGLTVAGSVYAITPHGTQFAAPVTVRLPKPAAALPANQVYALAKAEVGGDWELLGNATDEGGALSAPVQSFSFFAVVVVTYPVSVVDVRPVSLVSAEVLDCGGQDCNDLVGPVTLHVRAVVTGSQLPSFCPVPGDWRLHADGETGRSVAADGSILLTLQPTLYGPTFNGLGFGVSLRCPPTPGFAVPSIRLIQLVVGRWREAAYPALVALPLPATTETAEGGAVALEATLMGGATGPITRNGYSRLPTSADSAVVEWQRSDDQGSSWRTVAQSLQYEANARPFGGDYCNLCFFEWAYWRVTHGFTAGAADSGALYRVRACYTPPDVAPPPCVYSGATTLVVAQASALPAFSTVPSSLLVRSGQTASFSATATGTPAPTLQWQARDAGAATWADIAGATGTTYTTTALALADNGRQLRVVARNALGSEESPPVSVSVSDLDIAPTITTQPATIAVATGGDAVFAIAARGTEALSYQWRFNGNAIAGANSAVLKLAAVSTANAGRYSVVVSNAAGSATSNEATLDVTAGAPAAVAPTIVTQPAAVSVNEGNTATFAVGVGGTAPLSYQWLKEGQPIAGATAAYYSIAAVTSGQAGNYAVRVSNVAGSVTSASASLSVTAAVAPVAVSISTQPSAQVQLPGGSATFAVAASGTGPLSYQWLKNGSAVAGATGPVLLLNGVSSNDVASYSVTVSNALGSLTSSTASLTVVGAPTITTAPAATSVVEGSTASFSVVASGSSLGYQWTRNGVAIAGATSASYTTPTLTLSDNGAVYGVVVYSGAGVAIGAGALLTVTAAPPVATGPLVLATNSNSNSLSVLRANASTGELSSLGTVNTGSYPYKVVVSPNGRFAFVSNVVSATLQPFSLDVAAGTVTAGTMRATANPYGVAVDPQNRFVWVANYGTSGTVSTFLIDASTGALTPSGSPVSSGGTYPYAVTAHPNGNFIFVVNEAGGNVAAYTVNASTGVPTLVGTYGNLASPQSLVVSPNGQHLFVAEAGNNRVSSFAIHASTGALTAAGNVYVNGAGSPSGIAVHPGGLVLYVANGNSHNVGTLSVNASTGALANLGTPVATGSGPQGLVLNSAGTRLYVANGGGNSVSTFSVNAQGDTLTALGGATATGGSVPAGIAVTP